MSETNRVKGLLRSKKAWGVVAVIAVIWLLAGGKEDATDPTQAYFVVKRGPLTISVIQSATVQSREQVKVLNEVPGNNRILWLIEEGKMVAEGDLLVTLDSSSLEEQMVEQQIREENANAEAIRAKENFQVKKLEEEGELAKVELALKLAKMDLEAYGEEQYPQQIQQAEADITIAQEEIQRATDKVSWSTQLSEEGYLTRSELQADELAEKRARLNLQLAEGKLRTLREYTFARTQEKLQAEVVEAERNLDRIRHKYTALFVQGEADIRAKESELERQTKKLDLLKEHIEKCTILAPVGGMVVYFGTGQGRRHRGNDEQVAEGSNVRERQHLISLPTASAMMAQTRIYESSIEKIEKEMPARITADSMPGVEFAGWVEKVSILPEAEMGWLNSNLKSYTAEVYIEGEADGLRPGMSCTVEIVVEEYDDAVYVPLQCVVHTGEADLAYVVTRRGPEARVLELGLDNQTMVRVLSGLKKGERVLLDPPLEDVSAEEASEMGQGERSP